MQMQGGTRPESLDVELYKSLLFQALLAADVKHFEKHTLSFWKRPDEVRTTSNIKKGQLVLVPVPPPLLNISTKNTSSGSGVSLGEHDIAGKAMEFFVVPVPRPYNKDDVFGDNTIVAAFWWVISSPSMSTTKRRKPTWRLSTSPRMELSCQC